MINLCIYMKDLILFAGDHYLDYEDWGEYRRTVSSYSAHPLYNANAFNDFDIALLRLSIPANFFLPLLLLSSCHLHHHKTIRLATLQVGLTLLSLPQYFGLSLKLFFLGKNTNAESQRKKEQVNKLL